MERGRKLVARPQSVWLVRDSLRGASADDKPELTGSPLKHTTERFLGGRGSPREVPGGRKDVSVLGFEDLLLEEVLLV